MARSRSVEGALCMLILLSPAKSLDFSPSPTPLFTEPEWLDESEKLIKTLRNKSEKAIAALMNLSPKLAKLNKERYA
ncbi:MAG TPA: peroxide stress protein YaaA, partial [Myxococcales bacterium]|nr:peroxide stress protein YaaA [Myxococcales bacterium]